MPHFRWWTYGVRTRGGRLIVIQLDISCKRHSGDKLKTILVLITREWLRVEFMRHECCQVLW